MVNATHAIHADAVVQGELSSRGIDAKTGVYGEHKVQIGKGLPISLDKIKVPSLPFAGFGRAKQIARGKSGVKKAADDLLDALDEKDDELDAEGILSALMAGQEQLKRLDRLGQLTQSQKDDTMWMFTKSVENLSNAKLASVYQSFTSAKMDLLQTALQREGEINPDARDARMAASRLFDLQALVLKEVSNRATVGMLEDLKASNPDDATLQDLRLPQSLSAVWGNAEGRVKGADEPLNVGMDEQLWHNIINDKDPLPNAVANPMHQHDMSDANLLTLVEVSAQSATIREKSALEQAQRLERRNIRSVSVKEMADVMRRSELTYNLNSSTLLQHIITNPNEPISNIFHLAEKGIKPKGDAYLVDRDVVEKQLFPELAGHTVRGSERPIYGALNVSKDPIGAANLAYGDAAIVFKPEVAKRSTFIADDTFYSPRICINEDRKENFYKLLDGANLPQSLVTALRDKNSPERRDMDVWLDKSAKPGATIHDLSVLPDSVDQHLKSVEHFGYVSALLSRCFIDKEATRTNMATYDNLESLVVNMGDINGNGLANAARRNRQGKDGPVILSGIQYIEAQIHGPVVPSRDIAEIRVNYASLPGNDAAKAAARRNLEAFGKRYGIKITVLDYKSVNNQKELKSLAQQQKVYNEKHVDKEKLESLMQDYRLSFEARVEEYLANQKDLPVLPPGMLRITGEALKQTKERFKEYLPENLALRGTTELEKIFTSALGKALEKGGDLSIKARCLARMEKDHLPFESEAQKAAFAAWICSSTSLSNHDAMRMVYRQATAQAKLFKEMAAANPPRRKCAGVWPPSPAKPVRLSPGPTHRIMFLLMSMRPTFCRTLPMSRV